MDRIKVENSTSLEEAVREVFGLEMNGRTNVIGEEMNGEVASAYDTIGKEVRQETYAQIVEYFRTQTDCYAFRHKSNTVGTIVEVGCGSGLLSIPLAEQTGGRVIGVDISLGMIRLAEENKQSRVRELQEERQLFQEKLPEYCKTVGKKSEPLDNLSFYQGSVYELEMKDANYILCRNALHRFSDVSLALKVMYNSLGRGGKMYIRDLRRDAPWDVVVKRIGEARWKSEALVRDYIGAMAGMLTREELALELDALGINDYTIRSAQGREFAQEVEYTCVVKKR